MLFSSISNSFKVEKFRYGFKLSKFTSSLNMADKTPLVTTAGKRVEVDGGTSMMAVRRLIYRYYFCNNALITLYKFHNHYIIISIHKKNRIPVLIVIDSNSSVNM